MRDLELVEVVELLALAVVRVAEHLAVREAQHLQRELVRLAASPPTFGALAASRSRSSCQVDHARRAGPERARRPSWSSVKSSSGGTGSPVSRRAA